MQALSTNRLTGKGYIFIKFLPQSVVSASQPGVPTIFSAVILYGCETWSLNLEKEDRLRASEKKYWGEYSDLRKRTQQGN
jgi:hypothetical protein